MIYSNLDINMNLVQLLTRAEKEDFIELIKILHGKYGIKYGVLAEISKIPKSTLSNAVKRESFEGMIRDEKLDITLNEGLRNIRNLFLFL